MSQLSRIVDAYPRARLFTVCLIALLSVAHVMVQRGAAEAGGRPPTGTAAQRTDVTGAVVTTELDQDAASHAFMPLVGRSLTIGMLAPPRTVVVPTHTPAPSDTPEPSATFTQAPTPTPTIAPLDVEEDSPLLSLEGAWQQVNDSKASGGKYTVARTAGDMLTVRFAGDHIVIYRMLAQDGGQAAVSIDGVSYGNLVFYFSERRYQVPAIIDNLPAGGHILTLTVSDRSPSGSTGTAAYIDRLQAPGPYTVSSVHNEALARANHYRDITGLPRIRSDRAIHLAAQGHADYDVRNFGGGHSETPGRQGYIGTRFTDRLRYFGYSFGNGEVMYWSSRHTPVGVVDGWVDTVYHRMPFLDHDNTDMGYGEAKGSSMTTAVIDFGRRDHVPPSSRFIVTYPVDGQTDVPLGWRHTLEAPDPLPGQPADVGYPISLHIAQPAGGATGLLPWTWDEPFGAARPAMPSEWSLSSATLAVAGGAVVPVYVIDKASDPNPPGYMPADVVFVMAKSFMAASTTYEAHMTGTDSQDVPFDVRWSFTTGGGAVGPTGYAGGTP